jgi:hypothetical protein
MDSRPTELWTVPRQEVIQPGLTAGEDYARSSAGHPNTETPERGPTTILQWVRPGKRNLGRQTLGMEFDGRRLSIVGLWAAGTHRRLTRMSIVEWAEPPSAEVLVEYLQAAVPRGKPSVRLTINSSHGIVRRFYIPRVPARKRQAAALWEGKQLVPFPLNEQSAYVGMEFVSAGERGWRVTLVALPRQDAEVVVEAVRKLGWYLSGLSLAGTLPCRNTGHRPRAKNPAPEAVVFYSPRRNSFAVFDNGRLVFHYDLGPLPGYSADPTDWIFSDKERSTGSWIAGLGPAINDAFDFYISAQQGTPPSRLTLAGVRQSVGGASDHIGEWEERFTDGIDVMDPLHDLTEGIPDHVSKWIDANMGLLTYAAMTASIVAPIDLTPAPVRKHQRNRRLITCARTAFILSIMGAIMATGLLFEKRRTTNQEVETARRDSQILATSKPVVQITANLGELARLHARLAEIRRSPTKWMPWTKTILGTLPANARLTELDAQLDHQDAGGAALQVLLGGTLSTDNPPHAIQYKDWLKQLELLSGPGRVKLTREQTTVWKGRQRSAFAIELQPETTTITGPGK